MGCVSHYQQCRGDTLTLFLNNPSAKQVLLACSLDDFEPHKAEKSGSLWVMTLPSNKPFRYYYIVDGILFVPPCPLTEQDDFGSKNCVFDPEF